MREWRTIDSAPRDGTWILAVNAKTDPGRQHVVHYSERFCNIYQWTISSASMDFVAGLTHWMPLPNPPKDKE